MLRRIRDDERGAGYLAAFIVLFSVLLIAGVGILVDSARILAADRECSSIAMEAARAGANALDADLLRGGTVAANPAQAQATAASAAGSFVAHAGGTLQSVSVSGSRVTVVVSASVSPWFPLMSGRTVSKSATASAERDGSVSAYGSDDLMATHSILGARTGRDVAGRWLQRLRRRTDARTDDHDHAPTTTVAPTTTIDPVAAETAAVSEAARQARIGAFERPGKSDRCCRDRCARPVLRAR